MSSKTSAFKASFITAVSSKAGLADRNKIVELCGSIIELRAPTNITILSNFIIGFTCFMLVIKLILFASFAILEKIYRPFFTLALINKRLLLCLKKQYIISVKLTYKL